jgi:hypothetical protein
MPRTHSDQRLVCYCHRTKQFFYPARIVHGMGPCPYCDAYGTTRASSWYRPRAPQWHPLINAIAVIKTGITQVAALHRRLAPRPQRKHRSFSS